MGSVEEAFERFDDAMLIGVAPPTPDTTDPTMLVASPTMAPAIAVASFKILATTEDN